jgi:Spy/CpxP family protein refolding chaperone
MIINLRNLVLSFVLVGLFSFVAVAQDGPPPDDGGPERSRLQMIADALKLTDEQKQEYRRINMKQREELRVAQAAFKLAREEADVAIYQDQFNEAEVTAKIRKVAEAQATITGVRLRTEVAVRGILSAEQLIKFRELRERFAEENRRADQRRKLNQIRRNRKDRIRRDNPPPPPRPGGRP